MGEAGGVTRRPSKGLQRREGAKSARADAKKSVGRGASRTGESFRKEWAMKVRRFADGREFLARAGPFLARREAENTVPMGIVARVAKDPESLQKLGWGEALMLAAEDARGEVVGVGVKTGERRMVVTRGEAGAVAELARFVALEGVKIPGVVGPAEAAEEFVGVWARLTGDAIEVGHSLRLFECDRVAWPSGVSGELVEAQAGDVERMAAWGRAFAEAIGDPVPADERGAAEQRLREGGTVFWRDGGKVVSMAAVVARGERSARVGSVYTPAEFRNRGYASAVVAGLTAKLLGEGVARCVLFTDLANPTSNSIYPKVGYRAVGDFREYTFRARD